MHIFALMIFSKKLVNLQFQWCNVSIFYYITTEGFDAEVLLEEERQKMRQQYEMEMTEIRQKMESEKQTKEKMQNEVELMKQQYEEKLKALEKSAQAGTLSRQNSMANVLSRQQSNDPQNTKGLNSNVTQPILNAAMLK